MQTHTVESKSVNWTTCKKLTLHWVVMVCNELLVHWRNPEILIVKLMQRLLQNKGTYQKQQYDRAMKMSQMVEDESL